MIVYDNGRFRSYRPVDEARKLIEDEVKSLTAEERAALDILIKELAVKQKQELVDAAERLEWDPDTGPPAPISSWVNDEYLLGETARTLWPKLKEDMIEFFEGDYAECVLTGSARWGKDYFSTTAIIRVIYELYCLKRPSETLGLGRGEIIHVVPISHTKEAAQRVIFQGITRKLHLAPFWKGRFEVTKEEIRFPGKDIVITAGGSNENTALGLNVWSSLLDECARGDSLVAMANGELQTIEQLSNNASNNVIDHAILAYDGEKLVQAKAFVKPARFTDIFRVTLEDGRFIEATNNHPLLVRELDGSEKYIWVCDLAPGDEVIGAVVSSSIADRKISTSRVVSVLYAGRDQTYDLMSEPYGNFIANGIVVHNTNFMGKHKKGIVISGGDKDDKSESIYDSLRRRIRGTYAAKGLRGRLFMVSSKKSIHDFTERRLREAIAENDNTVFCRDYCLTGETRVPLLDGTEPTIRELAENYKDTNDRFWVYSLDLQTQLIVPGSAHHPRLTRKNEPVLKVTLDDGSVVRATADHPFMLRSGEYKNVGDLVTDDSLSHQRLGGCQIVSVAEDGLADVYDLSVERFENFAVGTGVFVHNCTWDVRPNAFIGQKWYTAAVSQKIGRVRILKDDEKPEEHEIWFKFPEEYLKEFSNDPAGAARDIAGIALESFRPFFSNREAINDMMKPERPHPFHVFEWVTSQTINPIWENIVMLNVHGDPVPRCCPNAHRHAHMDLSHRHDATGFCVGHVAGETQVSRLDPVTHEHVKEDAPLIHIDLCLRILAPRAGEIEHEIVRGLLYTLRSGGIPIRSVSADKWMGLPNLQLIARHGFTTEEISTQRTLDPYLAAQSAMYERRIESPVYPFLAKELRELELNEQGTKVDHPKDGTKDVADALVSVVYYLTKNWRSITIGSVSKGVSAHTQNIPGVAIPLPDGNFRWPDEPPLPKEGDEDWGKLPTWII